MSDFPHGVLLVDKEPGPTSHDIIDRLRKATGIRKIGHAGTLDPFADGLLVCLVGKTATRLSQDMVGFDKEYIFGLRLGKATDTLDREGRLTETNHHIDIDQVLMDLPEVIQRFVGKKTQIPPMYSAKKVKGKKLYELAREGKTIERKPVDIEIYSLELLDFEEDEFPLITFRAHCSSGTYIRVLGADIAAQLGYAGHLESLRRTHVGDFSVEDAIDAQVLTEDKIRDYLISVEDLEL